MENISATFVDDIVLTITVEKLQKIIEDLLN